jgi:hypothetical protein
MYVANAINLSRRQCMLASAANAEIGKNSGYKIYGVDTRLTPIREIIVCHQQWRGAAIIGRWYRMIQALCDWQPPGWYTSSGITHQTNPRAQIGRMCYRGHTNDATPANHGATRSGMQVVYHKIRPNANILYNFLQPPIFEQIKERYI